MKAFLLSIIIVYSAIAQAANITFTQGENPTLSLTAANDGVAFDITGATIVTNFMKDGGAIELSIPNSQHTILVAASGTFTVDLTTANTDLIKKGTNRSFVSVVTIGSNINYFWARKLLTVFSKDVKDN